MVVHPVTRGAAGRPFSVVTTRPCPTVCFHAQVQGWGAQGPTTAGLTGVANRGAAGRMPGQQVSLAPSDFAAVPSLSCEPGQPPVGGAPSLGSPRGQRGPQGARGWSGPTVAALAHVCRAVRLVLLMCSPVTGVWSRPLGFNRGSTRLGRVWLARCLAGGIGEGTGWDSSPPSLIRESSRRAQCASCHGRSHYRCCLLREPRRV